MASRFEISRLRQRTPIILPSMLLCDFGNLQREVRLLEEAGVSALHLDVMDGCFVPNFSYGLTLVRAFRQLTDLPLDVHLMMVEPEKYVEQFCDVGSSVVTIHAEAVRDPRPVLERIRSAGCAAGIAINPRTPVSAIEPVLELCDLVLVMTVQAGFGGQAFMPEPLTKLSRLRELTPDVVLEVDGGISNSTVGPCVAAGADWLVVGSAIFGTPDYGASIRNLQSRIDVAARSANPT
jgi:ribulose-phosphate 3-epimerase